MNKCIAIILMFFYIYPIQFVWLPISTRLLFSCTACLYFIYDLARARGKLKISLEYFPIFFTLLFIAIFSLISISLNGTSDLEFIKYPISMIAVLLAANAFIRILKESGGAYNYTFLLKAFITVVFIQSILSVVFYILPSTYEFIISIQAISVDEAEKMSSFSGFRFMGFGSQYFGAGITHGLALIMLAYLIRIGEYDACIPKASVVLFFIFVVGVGMARTTFIGFGIAMLLLFMPNNSFLLLNIPRMKRNIIFLSSIVFIIFFLMVIVSFFFPQLISSVEPIVNFALEIFINYFNSGELASASTSQLETMYIWPANIYTYVIGDGLYSLDSGLYYMDTDVGYLRLIFYFGVFGMLSFFIFQYVLFSLSFSDLQSGKLLLILVFIYLLTLNLKGFTDLSSVVALLFSVKVASRNSNVFSNGS